MSPSLPDKITWSSLTNRPSARYSMNSVTSEAHYHYPIHGHEGFCEWILVTEGELKQVIHGKKVILKAGHLMLIREFDVHGLQGKNVSFQNINFLAEDLLGVARCLGKKVEVRQLLLTRRPPRFFLADPAKEQLMDLSRRLFEAQDESLGDALIMQFLMSLVIELIVAPIQNQQIKTMPGWLQEGLSRLDDPSNQGLKVSALPRIFNRSAEHISRCFRQHLGRTPSSYLNQRRLDKAALMLAHSNQPILEISLSAGFNHLNYFYQNFKHKFGMTPRQYRKAYGQGI